MRTDGNQGQPQAYSRRSFLAKLSLGLAAIAGSGLLLRNLFSGGREEPDPDEEFPGEDSIFHPRRDPRLEARERGQKT